MQTFIHSIPKTELHLHIEGTLEPTLMFKLAEKNKIKLPYHSIEDAEHAYNFNDLQSFLDLYYLGMSVLITEQDFYDLTMSYIDKISQQNVRHIEIFFDPQAHTKRNISFDIVINGIHHALVDAKKKYNISSKLIICFLRDLTEQDAFATFKLAIPHKDKLIAIGLCSAEKGNPPNKFQNVFAEAMKNGFLTVAHAGEEGPPEYIWEALNLLKVKRIDHGVRCLEDPKLVEYLVTKQIPLTVCPLSNIKLRVFDKLQDHPLKKMLDLGLCVTINSDDPAYFGGYIEKNYIDTQKALDLSKQEILQVAKNSINATFLSEAEKTKLLLELERI